MMNADPRNLVVIAVFIVVLVLVYRDRRKVLDENLKTLADLLHGQIDFPFLGLPICARVTGRYKGRSVTCCWNCCSRHEDFEIYIEPLGIPQGMGIVGPNDGEPTEYTIMVENKIYYWGPSGFVFGRRQSRPPHLPPTLLARLNKDDAVYYFEHLTKAAEVVESGKRVMQHS
jgi:hypothetical protein